jgi:hypothetical protein
MKKITRKAAKARGKTRYYTGKACGRGHIAERLVSSRNCLECYKEATRRYDSSPLGKERRRRYDSSPLGKEAQRRRAGSPLGKEAMRRYDSSPLGKEKRRRYKSSPLGKEAQRRYDSSPKGRENKRKVRAKRRMKWAMERNRGEILDRLRIPAQRARRR